MISHMIHVHVSGLLNSYTCSLSHIILLKTWTIFSSLKCSLKPLTVILLSFYSMTIVYDFYCVLPSCLFCLFVDPLPTSGSWSLSIKPVFVSKTVCENICVRTSVVQVFFQHASSLKTIPKLKKNTNCMKLHDWLHIKYCKWVGSIYSSQCTFHIVDVLGHCRALVTFVLCYKSSISLTKL